MFSLLESALCLWIQVHPLWIQGLKRLVLWTQNLTLLKCQGLWIQAIVLHCSCVKAASNGYEYTLMTVDYVSRWVKAIPTRTSDSKVVLKFIEQNIFSRFGCPRAIISDGGTHFNNFQFKTLLKRYGVHHRITTPYHPQANGQIENCNREIKKILQKICKLDGKDWSKKIYDALWAYRTA